MVGMAGMVGVIGSTRAEHGMTGSASVVGLAWHAVCRKAQLLNLDRLQVDPHLDAFVRKLEHQGQQAAAGTATNTVVSIKALICWHYSPGGCGLQVAWLRERCFPSGHACPVDKWESRRRAAARILTFSKRNMNLGWLACRRCSSSPKQQSQWPLMSRPGHCPAPLLPHRSRTLPGRCRSPRQVRPIGRAARLPIWAPTCS